MARLKEIFKDVLEYNFKIDFIIDKGEADQLTLPLNEDALETDEPKVIN